MNFDLCAMLRWFGLFILLTAFTCHKFYFSNTEVFHNQENETLEITMRLFTDDLERAIAGDDAGQMRLGDAQENPAAQQMVEAYVQKHFQIQRADSTLSLAFIGKEVEYDITWIYLEAEGVSEVDGLKVKSRVFTDLFPEQVNEVHLESGSLRHTVSLNKENNTRLLTP